MNRFSKIRPFIVLGCCLLALQVMAAGPASAFPFTRSLQQGDTGRDVKSLEVRVAGWYPSQRQRSLKIDGKFTARTTVAVTAFQSFYGLASDGIAGPATFAALSNLQDPDGSTVNFAWSEFQQNVNRSCSAKANAYAGTFDGGMGSPSRVKGYVRRLMWRLEALRAKGGGHDIGINSGFRSVDYNKCIGGATSSQHLYGSAADQKMAYTTNHQERVLGRATDFSGIGCYSQLTHNHFDIRMDNKALPSSQFWWWPQQNANGEDLDEGGKPCSGETTSPTSADAPVSTSATAGASAFGAPRQSMSASTEGLAAPTVSAPDPAPEVLTRRQVHAFAAAGETSHLGRGD
jgi:zinc D-Ala-D-Ala carboxypeptidase